MAQFPALPLFTDAYLGDTTHLTTLEHGAYLLLLMAAWRSPTGDLPDDDKMLARYSKMTLANWLKVRPIIEELHEIIDGKWVQRRLRDEKRRLEDARAANIAAGKISALKRKQRHSTTVAKSLPIRSNETSTKFNQPTPTPTIKKDISKDISKKRPDDVPDQLWKDWVAHRKNKKSTLSETVLKNFRREADKAGITLAEAIEISIARNWQGFEADWVLKGNNHAASNHNSSSQPLRGHAALGEIHNRASRQIEKDRLEGTTYASPYDDLPF